MIELDASDKPKVLIVDDEKDQVELLCLQLEDEYLPIPAYTGKEAIELVKAKLPDLILLDLMLPESDGYEICSRLKSDPDYRFIPIIIISGLIEKPNKIKATQCGADDFINKPIDRFELKTRIKSLIRIKKNYEALQESENRYKQLFNNSPAVTLLVDPLNYRIVDANDPACAYYGYAYEEVTAKKITDISTFSQERNREISQQVFSKKKGHFYSCHKLASGEIRHVEMYVNTISVKDKELFFVNVYDITASKKTERKLAESEEKFKQVVELSIDGIFIETANGEIADCNDAACKIFGYDKEELLGLDVAALLPESFTRSIPEIIASKEITGNKTVERINKRKDGTLFPAEIATRILKLGNEERLIVYVRDITERKKAEEALINAKTAAEAANRTKSEFLATMSHELKTPLNSIIGFSDLLKEEIAGSLNEKQSRYVQFISSSGKNLLNIINDILELSKAESGNEELNIEVFSLDESINKVISMVLPQIHEKNIKLNYNSENRRLWIFADEVKFQQIMSNLLSNAIKFTPSGGSIDVISKKEVELVIITVRDTGIGIPEDSLDKIFKPFIQIDSSLSRTFEGTGLGLTLVKKYVEMHGGNIHVESKIGEGSSFRFELPVIRQKIIEPVLNVLESQKIIS